MKHQKQMVYAQRLTISQAYIEQIQLVLIRLNGQEQEWVAAEPLPVGAVAAGKPRPGYAGVLIASD